MTGEEGDARPAPFTPADCDLRGVEPPWDVFTRMAVAQYGVSFDEAKAATDEMRRQYWAEKAIG